MFLRSFPFACFLTLLLGACCVFGFAPYALWFLPIIAFAGWFLLLMQFSVKRQRLLLAACFGFAYFFAGIGWLYISLNHYGGMPPVLAILAVALFAAYLALFPLAAIGLPVLLGVSDESHTIERLEGLAEWTRNLAGVITVGVGLEGALIWQHVYRWRLLFGCCWCCLPVMVLVNGCGDGCSPVFPGWQ